MKGKKLLLAGAIVSMFWFAGGAAAAQKDNTYTIGVSIPTATHGWTGALNYFAQQAIHRLSKTYDNLDFVLTTASDAAEQVSDLEDMAASHDLDALVINPFQSDPLTIPVKRIADKGVFVTVVDRGLAKKGIADLYVAGNNYQFGVVAGKYFKKRLGDDGQIVVLRGLPTVIDNERVKGFMSVVKPTGIKVLAMEYADWNADKGFKIMQDFLQRFPDIDGVWAQDDDTARGVIAAIKAAGRTDEMFVVGGAGSKAMIKRVMGGSKLVPVDVLYAPTMIATAINLTALGHVSSSAIRGRFILDSPLITQENAKQYYHPNSPY